MFALPAVGGGNHVCRVEGTKNCGQLSISSAWLGVSFLKNGFRGKSRVSSMVLSFSTYLEQFLYWTLYLKGKLQHFFVYCSLMTGYERGLSPDMVYSGQTAVVVVGLFCNIWVVMQLLCCVQETLLQVWIRHFQGVSKIQRKYYQMAGTGSSTTAWMNRKGLCDGLLALPLQSAAALPPLIRRNLVSGLKYRLCFSVLVQPCQPRNSSASFTILFPASLEHAQTKHRPDLQCSSCHVELLSFRTLWSRPDDLPGVLDALDINSVFVWLLWLSASTISSLSDVFFNKHKVDLLWCVGLVVLTADNKLQFHFVSLSN